MASLQELLDKKAELERQIEATRRHERADAIAKVKALMAEQGLSIADISGKSSASRGGTSGGKVAAKFRNAATGESWSGRGLQPKWLKAALASGRKMDEFTL